MAGIAGITKPKATAQVDRMLDKMAYRGKRYRKIIQTEKATLGIISNDPLNWLAEEKPSGCRVRDGSGRGHYAEALVREGQLILSRDELGVAPLYTLTDPHGIQYFASEVKSLPAEEGMIREVTPGCSMKGGLQESYFTLNRKMAVSDSPAAIATRLRKLLDHAVAACIDSDIIGSWLSGGLDSSSIAALAASHVPMLHTFAAGLKGAPDLEFAREVAGHIGSKHHEVILSPEEMLKLLPDVIYHLESFDALLVRSSITNYAVALAASEYTAEVFSGEAGDEFFGGYAYLKSIPVELLDDELIDISLRLHNTAFQRVDRCASAHGTFAHVVFADPEVFNFALEIPVQYKIHQGIEKWILRMAMENDLPDRVLKRTKAKFWEGAGVGERLAAYANQKISDSDFRHERLTPSGETLHTKEELLYYRVFRELFPTIREIEWMGRTKGSPVQI